MKMLPALVATVGVFGLLGCQSAPQRAEPQTETPPAGNYTHAPSGMVFPEVVADFRRGDVTSFDASGNDVSAGYDFGVPDKWVTATVYVYPAPTLISIGSPQPVIDEMRTNLCAGAFALTKAEVAAAYRDITLLEETNALPPEGHGGSQGKKAVYEFTATFAGRAQRLRSELHLYCYVGEKWLVKYRITAPKDAAVSDDIARFMTQLAWTIPK